MTQQGPIPNSGLLYHQGAPLDNGGPMSAMSDPAVIGAGARPVGQGHMVPAPAPVRANMANAMVPPGQALPPQAKMAAPLAQPPQRPATTSMYPNAYQNVTTTAPAHQQVVPIPPEVPTKNKYGPAAGEGFDTNTLTSLGGAVKSRIYTIGTLICPHDVKTRSLDFMLSQDRWAMLMYKVGSTSNERVGDLSRVIPVGVELIAAKNELPIPVMLRMTGCKGRDYDWTTGERALLHMPAHYKETNGNRKLHLHAPTVSMSAFRRFGSITEKQLIANIQPMMHEGSLCDWSMVHTSSPVVEVIRASHETLKPTLANVKLTENWMPVKNRLIEAVQKFVRKHINDFPGVDMREGAISFCRTTKHNFCDPTGVGSSPHSSGHLMHEEAAVYVKLQVFYVVLSNALQSAPVVEEIKAPPMFSNHLAAGAPPLRALPAPQAAGV